jgi:hypothetical protein
MLMTFDALPLDPRQGATTWVEDGITATSGDGLNILAFITPGAARLDSLGWNSRIDFTTGGTFSVDGLMLRPLGSSFCAAPCDGTFDDPFPYISINGYMNDVLVGSLDFWRPLASAPELFIPSFGPIDRLSIATVGGLFGLPGVVDGLCVNSSGCGHLSIDSVSLTSVPEPETLLLLLPGVLAVLIGKRRKRT